MSTVDVKTAAAQLPEYLGQVQAGASFVITVAGQPAAELRPVEGAADTREQRPAGLCAGEFTVPEDFDAPLPEEVIADFSPG